MVLSLPDETLSGEEITDLIAGKPPNRDEDDDRPPSRGGVVPSTGKAKKGREGGGEASGDIEPQPQN